MNYCESDTFTYKGHDVYVNWECRQVTIDSTTLNAQGAFPDLAGFARKQIDCGRFEDVRDIESSPYFDHPGQP